MTSKGGLSTKVTSKKRKGYCGTLDKGDFTPGGAADVKRGHSMQAVVTHKGGLSKRVARKEQDAYFATLDTGVYNHK